MNPLTNVKNINKLNEIEADLGVSSKVSWHQQYKDSAYIFIGGLPYKLTEGDILAVFSQYGEIVNINLVRDKKTGKSQGYCFIAYEDQRSTILAVDNFNGIQLLGRTIRVDHVADYRRPKDHEDDDDVTKKLRSEGCAPKIESHTLPPSEDNGPSPKKLKKEKKSKKDRDGKKKKKKKEKKERVEKGDHSSGNSSETDSDDGPEKQKVSEISGQRLKDKKSNDNLNERENYSDRKTSSQEKEKVGRNSNSKVLSGSSSSCRKEERREDRKKGYQEDERWGERSKDSDRKREHSEKERYREDRFREHRYKERDERTDRQKHRARYGRDSDSEKDDRRRRDERDRDKSDRDRRDGRR